MQRYREGSENSVVGDTEPLANNSRENLQLKDSNDQKVKGYWKAVNCIQNAV